MKKQNSINHISFAKSARAHCPRISLVSLCPHCPKSNTPSFHCMQLSTITPTPPPIPPCFGLSYIHSHSIPWSNSLLCGDFFTSCIVLCAEIHGLCSPPIRLQFLISFSQVNKKRRIENHDGPIDFDFGFSLLELFSVMFQSLWGFGLGFVVKW